MQFHFCFQFLVVYVMLYYTTLELWNVYARAADVHELVIMDRVYTRKYEINLNIHPYAGL